jgi:hypothetical protein
MILMAAGPLSSVAEAMISTYQLLHRNHQDTLMRILRPFFQMELNLMGGASSTQTYRNPTVLSSSVMKDEEEELNYTQQTCNVKVEYCIYLCQGMLAFSLHNFVRARELIEKCTQMMRAAAGELLISSLDIQVQFWNALTAARMVWTRWSDTTKIIMVDREKMRERRRSFSCPQRSLWQSSNS